MKAKSSSAGTRVPSRGLRVPRLVVGGGGGSLQSLDPANTTFEATWDNGTAIAGTAAETESLYPGTCIVQRMPQSGGNSFTGPFKRALNGFPSPDHAAQGLRSLKFFAEDPEETDDSQGGVVRRVHLLPQTDQGKILPLQTRYVFAAVLCPTGYPLLAADGSWHTLWELKHDVDVRSPPTEISVERVSGVNKIQIRWSPFIGNPTTAGSNGQTFTIAKRIDLQTNKWFQVVLRIKASAYDAGADRGFMEAWYRWVENTPAGKASPPGWTQVAHDGIGSSALAGTTQWFGATTIGTGGKLRWIGGTYADNNPTAPDLLHYLGPGRMGTTFDSVVPAP